MAYRVVVAGPVGSSGELPDARFEFQGFPKPLQSRPPLLWSFSK